MLQRARETRLCIWMDLSIGGRSPDAIQTKFELMKKHKDTNVRILAYLDDWVLVVSSRERAALPLPLTLMHIQALRFWVNLQKNSMIPSQQFFFLRLEIGSISGWPRLSKHRVVAFHHNLTQFQLGCRLLFQTILQLTGMMVSIITVVLRL